MAINNEGWQMSTTRNPGVKPKKKLLIDKPPASLRFSAANQRVSCLILQLFHGGSLWDFRPVNVTVLPIFPAFTAVVKSHCKAIMVSTKTEERKLDKMQMKGDYSEAVGCDLGDLLWGCEEAQKWAVHSCCFIIFVIRFCWLLKA